MNMSVILSQMAILFIIMALGFAANKFNILTPDSNKMLSKVVINIAMPCTILSSVLSGEVTASGTDAAYFMLLSLAAYALVFIVSAPLPWLLRTHKTDNGLYRFMLVFGNVGFMGFPIIQSIFGMGAVFYVTLFNIAFSLLCFSVGIVMVSGKGDKINLKVLINPTMIVSVVTILLFYTKLHVPSVIADTAVLVGRMTTPSAMLVIGSTLAVIPFKEVFGEVRLYPLSVMKLLVVPLLTWLVLRFFITDQLMLGVLVTLSGMPAATNAAMLSMEYGGNEKLASKAIFITTLFSVATIPLIVFLLLS
jgi:malate permease and related proteins